MVEKDPRPVVLFLASTLTIGGAEEAVRLLVCGLTRSRYRPVVCCLRALGAKGQEIREAGIATHSGLLENRFDPRIVGRLVALMKRERVRILYCLDHDDAMFWGRVSAKLAGVPVIVTAIHTFGKWADRPSISRSNRMLLRMTQKVIAVAEKQKAYLVAVEGVDPERIEVIQNGIEINRYAARAAPGRTGPRRVSLVAAIRPEKGHDVFLRAAAQILAEGNAVSFWIVGDGPARAALEALASDLGVSEAVSFLGFRRDIPEILAETDVVTLSSHPAVETFPLSILEAMAASRPVVATRVGALDEIVVDGETGYLVPPGQPSALAEALSRFVRDPALATRMGRAGRARVEKLFSAERMVGRTEAMFDRLMSGSTRN